MSTKSIGITLIVLGALIMIFSRLMEVTIGDSGIVNINLLSEKQNTLIFGGLIFLAGIILYAAFKSKQTKEEETIEELKSKEKSNLIINRLKNIFSHQEGNTGPIKNRLLRIRGLFMDSSEGWKSIFLKLLIGFFFGIMAATNLWFIVYRWFRSQRGAPFLENIDSWTYTDNSYYFLFVLIILIAIKMEPLVVVLNLHF